MNEIKFTCPACGQHLAGDSSYVGQKFPCPSCQTAITMSAPAAPRRVGVVAPAPIVPPPMPPPASQPILPARTSRMAIASLACSIAGLPFGYLGTIPGIICGSKALRQIKKNPGLGGKGMALAGLITGCILSAIWIPLTYIMVVATISGFHAVSQMKNRVSAAPAMVNTDVAADLTPDGSGWRPDLAGVTIPDAPVSGRIQGLPFTVRTVAVDPVFGTLEFGYDNTDTESSSAAWKHFGLSLKLSDGSTGSRLDAMNPAQYFEEKTFAKYGKRTFLVQTDDMVSLQPPADWSFAKPSIRMTWLEPGPQPLPDRSHDTLSAPYKYALRLELDELKNGKLPGRIYLCVLDKKKSFICGRFVANVVAQHSSLPPDIKPDAAGWTLDLTNATIPDTLASGRITGRPFKTQAVELEFGSLVFRQGTMLDKQEFKLDLRRPRLSDPTHHFSLFDPAQFSGQTIIVSGQEPFGEQTRLSLWPMDSGMPDKYVMRLEFGELKDGKLPGRIYLCVLDRGKSFLCGKFVVVAK